MPISEADSILLKKERLYHENEIKNPAIQTRLLSNFRNSKLAQTFVDLAVEHKLAFKLSKTKQEQALNQVRENDETPSRPRP